MAEDKLAQEIEQLEQKRDALKESLRSANKRIYQWVVAALAAGSCACCTGAERSSNVMFAVVMLLIIVVAGTINLWLMKRRSGERAELRAIETALKRLYSELRSSI